MISRLRALLDGLDRGTPAGRHGPDELRLAAAALLVEAARSDATFDGAERTTIARLVREWFELDKADADALMAAAEAAATQSVQLFGFTRVINARFDEPERIRLMEMLWEVVLANGRIDAFEATLMRRLAGLIHVSDADSTQARRRVQARRAGNGGGIGAS